MLGATGFGYVADPKTGEYMQFPQQGTLVIEDNVEIGANTTIDRGALEETRIGAGTKIDNQVHIGHNCIIGEERDHRGAGGDIRLVRGRATARSSPGRWAWATR